MSHLILGILLSAHAYVSVLLAVGQTSRAQGVIVGNFSAADLCQAFPSSANVTGLNAIRQHCGFAEDDLYPTLGYPDIAIRRFNSVAGSVEGYRQDLLSRFGQQCADATVRHFCRQYLPRCDTTGRFAVWDASKVEQECVDIKSTCNESSYDFLQKRDGICTSKYVIKGSFKIGECRTPEPSLLASNCSRAASTLMPTYYEQRYSKANQEILPILLFFLSENNVSHSCQQSYLDVACWPSLVCFPDNTVRDVRQRAHCEEASRCLREEGRSPNYVLPVKDCSVLGGGFWPTTTQTTQRQTAATTTTTSGASAHLSCTAFVMQSLTVVAVLSFFTLGSFF